MLADPDAGIHSCNENLTDMSNADSANSSGNGQAGGSDPFQATMPAA
jgi:hypothetical protein